MNLARNNLLNDFLAILAQVPRTVPHHIHPRRCIGIHLDPTTNPEYAGDAAYADTLAQVVRLGSLGGRLLPEFLHQCGDTL